MVKLRTLTPALKVRVFYPQPLCYNKSVSFTVKSLLCKETGAAYLISTPVFLFLTFVFACLVDCLTILNTLGAIPCTRLTVVNR